MSNIVIRPKDREEWKPIVGFQGLYEVSSLGEIRSIARLVNNGKETKRRDNGRLLRADTKSKGIWIEQISQPFIYFKVSHLLKYSKIINQIFVLIN